LEQDILPYEQEFEAESEKFESPAVYISRWAKYATIAFAITGSFMIFGLAPYYRWGVCLAAYFNCLLYGVFAIYFLKKGTLSCLIPVLVPLWMVVGSCLGIIFFGMFYPDESYSTSSGSVSFFAGGFRYQFVIMLFMLTYFIFMSIFLRKESTIRQHPGMVSERVGKIALYFVVVTVSLQIMLWVLPVPFFVALWIGRLFERYHGLLFVAGVVIVALPRFTKIWFTVFLTIMIVLFSIKNARGWVLIPCAAFFCGMFFFSQMKNRTRITLALVAIIGLPLFVVVSNISRTVLGAGSSQASMTQRVAAFKDWRSVLQQTDVATSFFGRMFFTAGNKVVAYTPSLYEYRHFYPVEYIKEFAVYMLPDQMVRRLMGISDRKRKLSIVFQTYYVGTWLLRDYGMQISETSSIEPSIIGHFWMLGGYFFVFLGGIAVACTHGISAWIIKRAWLKNPDKGVLYFGALFFPFLSTTPSDFIMNCRDLLWGVIYATVAYMLMKPFLKNVQRDIPSVSEYYEQDLSEYYQDNQTEIISHSN
jgi:hypothetical protein